MHRISVLGMGGWGTALAILCVDNGCKTTMWGKFEDEKKYLEFAHINPKLEGVTIPPQINLTTDIEDIANSQIVIIATPSFAVRETAARLRGIVSPDCIIVSVAKGFERGTLMRFSAVIDGELTANSVVALSGPSHAEEVARKMPTLIVAASENEQAAKTVQSVLSNDNFRVYTNDDIIGVEIGAALKNIIAVAAGICDGLGLGDNTIAALITRGIHEISLLGCRMGARRETFAGLSGIGDLIVTCTSKHSRNRRFGKLVGSGVEISQALETVGMTVEGYYAADAAMQLARQYSVSMPIVEECYGILYKGTKPAHAIKRMMKRSMKKE